MEHREQQVDLWSIESSKRTHGELRAVRGPMENREQQGDSWRIESSKGTQGL